MKTSYGRPPWFVPAVFVKVAACVALLAAGVGVAATLFGEPLGTVDLVGILVTAPILSYLIHLWLLPWPGQEPDNKGA